LGKVNAATATTQTQTTPASTPSASQVWKLVPCTLHQSISTINAMTVTIAGTGVCVRSFTSASFAGRIRSNTHANTERIGMKLLPTIAGRLQNKNEPTIRTVRMFELYVNDAKKW